MRTHVLSILLLAFALVGAVAPVQMARATESVEALQIVGPRIVGIRPGTPFLHLVGVTRRGTSRTACASLAC